MSDEFQKEEISKTSPYKKAGYFAAFIAVTCLTVPFVFGINSFFWIATWLLDNWPRLILVGALIFWLGKSHLSG